MMKLQFDPNQTFQIDAVAAVTDLFEGQPQGAPEYTVIQLREGLPLFVGQERTELGVGNRLLVAEDKLRDNLRAIQARNDIEVGDPAAAPEAWELFDGPANQARPCPHFSVEMETGTGKTYVYLRTIFELSQRYGFQKFIIVVPSVAIREGVLKNIEITAEHFRALYNNLKRPGEASGADGDPALALAQTIDAEVRRVKPDGWRGVETRERVIQAALYEILRDEAEVERIFRIIEAQSEY